MVVICSPHQLYPPQYKILMQKCDAATVEIYNQQVIFPHCACVESSPLFASHFLHLVDKCSSKLDNQLPLECDTVPFRKLVVVRYHKLDSICQVSLMQDFLSPFCLKMGGPVSCHQRQ